MLKNIFSRKKFIFKLNKFFYSQTYNSLPNFLVNKIDDYGKLNLEEYDKLNSTIAQTGSLSREQAKRLNDLRSICELFRDIEILNLESKEFNNTIKDMVGVDETDDTEDLKGLMEVEESERTQHRGVLYEKVIDHLLSDQPFEDVDEVTLELSAGVGGQEAMLFAEELLQMYLRFAESRGWVVEKLDSSSGNLNSLRSGQYRIHGHGVYTQLKFESGIHRVQRVPITSSQGKIHTSTVAVVILPYQPDEVIEINESDIKVDAFRSSGPGGQSVNKTNSCVRVTYLPSGIAVVCQEHKLQQNNKELAMQRLQDILRERQTEERVSKEYSNRKLFVGSRMRSEKIRTYNFQQDRLTEHRLPRSWPQMSMVMANGALGPVVEELQLEERMNRLQAILGVSGEINLMNGVLNLSFK